MLECWKEKPDDRPSFTKCKGKISSILEKKNSVVHQAMLNNLYDATRNIFLRVANSTLSSPTKNLMVTSLDMDGVDESGPSEASDDESSGEVTVTSGDRTKTLPDISENAIESAIELTVIREYGNPEPKVVQSNN